MKKILVFILSISILFVVSLPVYAQSLNDIQGHQNQKAIEYLISKNVVGGYPDGTFQPDKTINRAELIKILIGAKADIMPTVAEYNNCFPDVTTEWFAPYVCYAKNMRWVDGYPDGTFKPSKTVNKVEAIKMLVNVQEYYVPEEVYSISFSDINLTDWFARFIRIANQKGLLKETDRYEGNKEMTRASISESIYRAMKIKSYGLDSFKDYKFYKVVKVVDGDTIAVDMDGQTVTLRLIGIDTPESVHPTKPVQCYAMEASNKAKEILSDSWVFLLKDETQGDKDKYDRLLRYVFLEDDTNFNMMMIEEGYAHEYTYDMPYKYQTTFKIVEANARELKRGLWADDTCGGAIDKAPVVASPSATPVATSKSELSPSPPPSSTFAPINTSEPIVTPITTVTPMPTIEPTLEPSTTYNCSSNTYNCSDFSSHSAAQNVFDYCMSQTGIDIHRLDGDHDMNACESLK